MAVDFAINVRQWVEKAKGNVDAATYAVGEALVARVKELTPVKTGYLRSSWQLVNEQQRSALRNAVQEAASSFAGEMAGQLADQALSKFGGTRIGRIVRLGGKFVAEKGAGRALSGEPTLEGSLLGTAFGMAGGAIAGAFGTATTAVGGFATAAAGNAFGTALGTYIGDTFLAGSVSQFVRGTPLEPIANMIGTTSRLGEIVYIVNAAPYARRIEYGFVGKDALGRQYAYRGVGMMQQTISEAPSIAEQVLAKFNG